MTADRYNEGKPKLSFIPISTLYDAAHVFEFGSKKYSVNNWEKGFNWLSVYDSLMRHMSAWRDGEDLDPESGLPHLGHAMCNMIMLSRFKETHPEMDDRYNKVSERSILKPKGKGKITQEQARKAVAVVRDAAIERNKPSEEFKCRRCKDTGFGQDWQGTWEICGECVDEETEE